MSIDLGQERCWVCGMDVYADDNYCRKCGNQLVRSKSSPVLKKSEGNRFAVGTFLVAFGGIIAFFSYLMAVVPMLAFGLGSLLIGIMVLYLSESRNLEYDYGADSTIPSLLNVEKLLHDLDLTERGIYLPPTEADMPKVFIPMVLTPSTRKPSLELNKSRRIFVTVGKNPEDRGVLLESPGVGLLSAIERTLGTSLKNLSPESLAASLDSAFKALGIAEATSLSTSDDSMEIQMQLSRIDKAEIRLRNLAPRLTTQIGTSLVSALAVAVSKSTGKYVTLKSAILDESRRRLVVDLKLVS